MEKVGDKQLWLPLLPQRSIFFKLIKDSNKNFITSLLNQKRSAPELVEIINEYLYENKIESTIDTSKMLYIIKAERRMQSIFINVNGMEKATGYYEEVDGFQDISFYNAEEVQVIKRLLVDLKDGVFIKSDISGRELSNSDFLILSGYSGQVRLLQEELNTGDENYDIRSIDSSQGSEKNIVVLSLVRTHQIGFLKLIQRIIVALSRPKHIMIIIGNAELLRNRRESDFLKLIIEHHIQKRRYFPSVLDFLA